jgi:hypothetical protein
VDEHGIFRPVCDTLRVHISIEGKPRFIANRKNKGFISAVYTT